ncbi:hypothetical protein D9M69_718410 [compost metagenome]
MSYSSMKRAYRMSLGLKSARQNSGKNALASSSAPWPKKLRHSLRLPSGIRGREELDR